LPEEGGISCRWRRDWPLLVGGHVGRRRRSEGEHNGRRRRSGSNAALDERHGCSGAGHIGRRRPSGDASVVDGGSAAEAGESPPAWRRQPLCPRQTVQHGPWWLPWRVYRVTEAAVLPVPWPRSLFLCALFQSSSLASSVASTSICRGRSCPWRMISRGRNGRGRRSGGDSPAAVEGAAVDGGAAAAKSKGGTAVAPRRTSRRPPRRRHLFRRRDDQRWKLRRSRVRLWS
jgi:hypothetical protein